MFSFFATTLGKYFGLSGIGFALGALLFWHVGSWRVGQEKLASANHLLAEQQEIAKQQQKAIETWLGEEKTNLAVAKDIIKSQLDINNQSNETLDRLHGQIEGVRNAAKTLASTQCNLDIPHQLLLKTISDAANDISSSTGKTPASSGNRKRDTQIP